MQHYQFKPRLVPALATVLGMALFIHLGNWQVHKGEKRAAELAQYSARAKLPPTVLGAALVDPVSLQDAPVAVRGRYVAGEQYFLDNRQEDGRAGVHVISALQIDGSTTRVLIDRGWVAWGAGRSQLPLVPTPDAPVQVTGIASLPSAAKFFLMPDRDDVNPRLWSRIDLARYATRYAGPLQPLVILQNAQDASDGLVRNWPAPEDKVAMHQSYSLQWYGMAAALLLFFLFSSRRQQVHT